MIAWFARNHVAANLLMVCILFGGLMSLSTRIPLEVFPSFEADIVTVSMSLRGATPEDVEQGVTIRIEEAVQDLEGIKEISSRSQEGSAKVNIEIDDDYDPRELLADIKSRVDGINTFPGEADRPVISLATRRREVMSVTVSGPYSEREIREYAERVRDDLSRLDDVTQVELDAVREYEIAIEPSQDRLREFGLTLADIGTAIDSGSIDLSAGNLRTDGGDVLLRSKGQAYRRDDFERLVVKTNEDGSIIRLGDIARVSDGFEEVPLRTRFNGEPAALIEVYRVGNQSALEVSEAVRGYIDSQQNNLPVGMTLSYWDDDSEIVKKRLSTLVSNALQGGALVLLLLTLFLRPSIAFWVFLGIPISFMGAFLLLPVFGVTLNVMSLFGFILVLGIVVDDAIVTGENVYSHMRRAESSLHAAIRGTQEVAIPVTFGVLTTVAAFLPLAFVEGRRGAFFAQIPAVVIPVLLFSLIESKFVLPAHLKHIRLRQHSSGQSRLERWQQSFADGFERAVVLYYRPLLKTCLRHRYTTLALFGGILVLILSLILSGWTRFVFFPRIQSETARASLTMPAGTAFDVTDRYVVRMLDAARELKDKYRDEASGESLILNILATTGEGGGSSNVGEVRFEIQSPENRSLDITSSDLVREWRQRVGQVPGVESLTYRAEFGRGGSPVDVQLSGLDLVRLGEAAEKVRQRLATYPTLYDIEDSLSDGKQEIQLELTEQGNALGLSRAELITQVRQAFFGIEVQRIQRGRDDVRVMVRLPAGERQAVSDLQEMLIRLPDGRAVPLAHLATLKPGKSPSAIYRIDRFRTVNITADLDKQATNMTVLAQDLKTYLDGLMLQYPGLAYSLEGEAREQEESFGSLQLGLAFVLFVIYSLLAIPFRSYLQPLIVMSVIPFGAIGAVIGHWIMGMDLTIMSMMGLMALIGVVVNDSLVLVDFINKHRAGGNGGERSLIRAVLAAGTARFRPVLLTSLTTFIGLMPLLFEKSTQAQFLIPMAVSLGFGILFATVITLLMVPVNYLVLEDLRRLRRRNRPAVGEVPAGET
ncbi:acriflavin resistance protein [Marinobacterium nitratireducens]|uniref:Acriflavin resistance protein n=1 Tax=Marinobacterium nitratireducens TaxID=518897 RepID=A0A917Z7V1_9GAMM|nr:efflux RND transporter permease subunit [Marinobacterium nitratireducens]GGO77512.1 acriflavin resistance protein [Marinobacterium nitratireducens]